METELCPLCRSPRVGQHVDISNWPKWSVCRHGFASSSVIVAIENKETIVPLETGE